MFNEGFEEYKKRMSEYAKYRYFNDQKDSLAVFLLWEILEVIWYIGKHLTPHAGDLRSAQSVQTGQSLEGETNSGESHPNRANA